MYREKHTILTSVNKILPVFFKLLAQFWIKFSTGNVVKYFANDCEYHGNIRCDFVDLALLEMLVIIDRYKFCIQDSKLTDRALYYQQIS